MVIPDVPTILVHAHILEGEVVCRRDGTSRLSTGICAQRVAAADIVQVNAPQPDIGDCEKRAIEDLLQSEKLIEFGLHSGICHPLIGLISID